MDIKPDPFRNPKTPPHNSWRYDPTITLGHLLTVATVLLTVVIWGVRLEGRIDTQDALLKFWNKQIDKIEGSLARIEDRLNKITDVSNGGR